MWKLFQLGNLLPQKGEILRRRHNIFYGKRPCGFISLALGTFIITYEGQEVLKLFEVRATSMMGMRIKKKTKQKPPMHHSSKGVILESPCMGGLSIWLNFHLKEVKMPLHRNAYFIFEY